LDIKVSKDFGEGGAELPQALTHELIDLSIAIDLIGQATASRLGINQTDLICLDLLVRQGPMGAGQLATALGLTTAAISAMATRLEAGGYAHREMDPNDRRRVVLHASPSGASQAFSLFDDLYHATAALNATYKQRDLQMLIHLLRRYRQLITDQATALRADPAPSNPKAQRERQPPAR
jgi:DNA-binding MarR family transcriptional regulator